MPQRQWSRDQTDALIDSAELHSRGIMSVI
jgi:hypothetical protein